MDTFALRIDGGRQPRAQLDETTIERYCEEMALGLWDFARVSDPAVAFYDGSTHWLADGYHRLEAAKRAGKLDEFSAGLEIRQGTLRDAILYSCGANAHHGWPRSNDDKRRAVIRVLGDAQWSAWSDREIARRCHVDHRFVGRMRKELTGEIPSERTYTSKHGTVATMDTSAIGKRPVPARPQQKIEKPADPSPQAEWRLPERASGGVHAQSREIIPPPATNNITTAHGEVRIDPSLSWGKDAIAANSSFPCSCDCNALRHYLETPRPRLPSQRELEAVPPEHLATIQRLVEQHHSWAVALVGVFNKSPAVSAANVKDEMN